MTHLDVIRERVTWPAYYGEDRGDVEFLLAEVDSLLDQKQRLSERAATDVAEQANRADVAEAKVAQAETLLRDWVPADLHGSRLRARVLEALRGDA